jgi:hypothetical protein
MNLKKYLIVFDCLLIIAASYVSLSCADSYNSNYFSIFTPEIIEQPKFAPFFRDPDYLFYQEPSPQSNVDSINIEEWETFFENKVKQEDLRQLIYKLNEKQIDTIYNCLFGLIKPIKLIKNCYGLCGLQNKKAVYQFLMYLSFAKKCEVNQQIEWYDIEKIEAERSNLKLRIDRLIPKADTLLKITESDFIKERYYFQKIKLYFNGGQYAKAIQVFEKQKFTYKYKNSSYYRALGYVAGCYYKMRKYAISNYLYANIYTSFPSYYYISTWSFHPVEDKDWQASLVMAKNDEERCALWYMLGCYFDAGRAINQIYKINPKADYLDLLLVRFVNIQEEYYFNQNEFTNNNRKADTSFIANINFIADAKNTNQPFLWYLCAAYINILNSNFTKAAIQIAILDGMIAPNLKMAAQLKIVKIAYYLKCPYKSILSWEEQFEPHFNSLFSQPNSLLANNLRTDFLMVWVKTHMANVYLKEKDTLTALLINNDISSNYLQNTTHLENAILYLNKKPKSTFHQSIQHYSAYQLFHFKELLILHAVYQNKLKKANTLLDNNPNIGNELLLGNPFKCSIKDCHDCDHLEYTQKDFTPRKLVEKMSQLQLIISEGKADANHYFELANAYYNITYYGNQRLFYNFSKIYGNEPNQQVLPITINKMDKEKKYLMAKFNTQLAYENYTKAIELSNDIEFKAKCQFLIAKCELMTYYATKTTEDVDDFIASNSYFKLKDEFENTAYFKEIIAECGYFVTFLKNKR